MKAEELKKKIHKFSEDLINKVSRLEWAHTKPELLNTVKVWTHKSMVTPLK